MRKCVELVATFADGTVMRWDEHDEGADLGAYILLENEGKLPAFRMESRAHVTRPLRKVTVVSGRQTDLGVDSGDCIYQGSNQPSVYLVDVLPDEARESAFNNWRATVCDYRITVEAVPVGGGE